jgi:hypothetical protein
MCVVRDRCNFTRSCLLTKVRYRTIMKYGNELLKFEELHLWTQKSSFTILEKRCTM